MEIVEPIRDRAKIKHMRAILSSNKRNELLFVMGINTGLRIGDLLKIKVGDVFDEKGKPTDSIYMREQKTDKVKRVQLGKNVQKALLDYWKDPHTPKDTSKHLFYSQKRRQRGELQGLKVMTRQNAYDILNHAARAVGIEGNVGTHTMRKTFGYHAAREGVSITLLQSIFNHAAPSITMRYIGITQDEMNEVFTSINLG